MNPVTRLIAILLFAAFVLPFASPALAVGVNAESGLPACCRRGGMHGCAMTMMERSVAAAKTDKAPKWRAPLEHCPYCPTTLSVVHASPLAAPLAEATYAEFFSHPAGLVQTESRRRVARDRSRHKRGPPAVARA